MYCMEERWKKGQYQQDDVGRVGEGIYGRKNLGQQRKVTGTSEVRTISKRKGQNCRMVHTRVTQ